MIFIFFDVLGLRLYTFLFAPRTLAVLRCLGALLALGVVGTDANADTLAVGKLTPEIFAEHLDRPQAVASWSKDAVLVAERSGRVLLLEGGGQRFDLGKIQVRGMRIFYVPESPFTEGIKDFIAFPGQKGSFLWCATTGDEKEIRWTLGRATVSLEQKPAAMTNEVMWQSEPQRWTRTSPPPFSGCKVAIDGQTVVVAMGANSRSTGSGRIMRVPMSGEKSAEVISTGHRNPSGLLIRSGVLWEVEHGPAGGDELNIIVVNGDYGWPDVSQGGPDDTNHNSFLKSRPSSIDPVVAWTPAIAPSSLTEFRGKLVVGSLKGTVLELTIDENNRVISQRHLLESMGRVRDVRASSDGKTLWLLKDGADATLFKITPDGG